MCEAESIIDNRPLVVETLNNPLSGLPLSPSILLTGKTRLVLPPPREFKREDLEIRPEKKNFIHFYSLFITWMVYLDPTYWPAASWLVSSVGRALHPYRRSYGFTSHTGLKNFFSGLLSTTSSVVFLAARISYIRYCSMLSISNYYLKLKKWRKKLFLYTEPE